MTNVYALYDSAAGAYTSPFFLPTDSLAQRALVQAVESDPHLDKHAADFTLFRIGTWDTLSGMFTSLATPHRVIGVHELKALTK